MKISLKMIHDNDPELTSQKLSLYYIEKICSLFLDGDKIFSSAQLLSFSEAKLRAIESPYGPSYDEKFNYNKLKQQYRNTHTLKKIKSLFKHNLSMTAVSLHIFLDQQTLDTVIVKQFNINLKNLMMMSEEDFMREFDGRLDEVIKLNRCYKRKLSNKSKEQLTLFKIHKYIHELKEGRQKITPSIVSKRFKFNKIENMERFINQYVYLGKIVSFDMLKSYNPFENNFIDEVTGIMGYCDPVAVEIVDINTYTIGMVHCVCQFKYDGDALETIYAMENNLRLERGALAYHIRKVFKVGFFEFKEFTHDKLQPIYHLTFAQAEIKISNDLLKLVSELPLIQEVYESLEIAPFTSETEMNFSEFYSYIHPVTGSNRTNDLTNNIHKRKADDLLCQEHLEEENSNLNSQVFEI